MSHSITKLGHVVSELRPPENWRNVWIVRLDFPCRHCIRQTSGTLLPSTTCDRGCSIRFPTEFSSRNVARCESADWNSFKNLTWQCSITFASYLSAIFEQLVSGTTDGKRRTNNMTHPFTWLKSLIFLSTGTSAIYCSCYRSQWRPVLATTNTDRI